MVYNAHALNSEAEHFQHLPFHCCPAPSANINTLSQQTMKAQFNSKRSCLGFESEVKMKAINEADSHV